MTLAPNDGSGSGVAATYYTSDGSTPTAGSSSGTSIALASDGIYTVKYFSTDNLANGEAVRTAATQVRIDKTAPTPASNTLSSSNSYTSSGTTYVRNGVLLQNSATDPTVNGASSGVASVAYYCAGSCTPSPGSAGTTLIGTSTVGSSYTLTWNSQPADGVYSLLARVTDSAGNTAGSAVTSVRVDNTPPTTSDNTASLGSGWFNTSKTVTLAPSDGSGSGVAATYSTSDGSTPTTGSSQGTAVTLTSGGVYTVKYFSVDNLANSETTKTAATQIHIDKTAPTPATTSTSGTYTSGGVGYIKNGAVLQNSATDPTVNGASSGVASVAYYSCAGSCTPSPGTTLIGTSTAGPGYTSTWNSQPADGLYSILARVTDNAGNSADSALIQLTVDNSGPTISTALADANANEAGYINGGGSFYVYANVTDAGSGVNASTISANLSGQCSGCSNVSLSASGGPFTIYTAAGPVANGVVKLTISGGTTLTYYQVVPAAGSQTLTFSGLNLSGLNDGTVTLSAVEYTPGGNGASGTKNQNVTKLTAPTTPNTAAMTYTDNTGTTADQVAGANGAGPSNGFLAFLETVGTHTGTTYYSGQLGGGGNFAKFNLAAEISTPTYSITAVDDACNLSGSVNWSPTDKR